MVFRKFAYADDLALLHSSGNWKDLEGTLSQGISTLSAYFQTWRLKLSHTKTVTAAFHLNNREAKRELKVYNNGRLLPFCLTPIYLVVKLDRSLTFRHHLVALRKKLSSRITLLRRLEGSGWGAGAKTLRIATLSLVYSSAEYCTPVWCRSAHTRLIDSVLNDALRIVTGCLRPTPTDHLPILSGMSCNFLKLNLNKTQLLICGKARFLAAFQPCIQSLKSNIHLDSDPTSCVKLLGLFIEETLSFDRTINKTCKICFYKLTKLRNLHSF